MALFDVPSRAGRTDDMAAAKKAKTAAKKSPIVAKSSGGLLDKIALARRLVEENLGKYRDIYEAVTDKDRLKQFVDSCIKSGEVAIDTETDGLDPRVNHVVGFSMSTPGESKHIYVPLLHKSYMTQEIIPGQIPYEFAIEQLQRIIDSGIDVDMDNAAFDIKQMIHSFGIRMHCTWDTYIAARCMNDNEGHGGYKLKKLHQKYCLDGKEDAFSFDDLFNGITFDFIPIDIAYLYGAHDSHITLELKQFQQKYLYYEPYCTRDNRNGMNGVSWVFFNIEMPIVDVVVDLEETGVAIDVDYAQSLQDTYQRILSEHRQLCYDALINYQDKIKKYRLSTPACKLSEPINLDSPPQVAILLYDIMKVPAEDGRSTDEKVLEKIDNDFTKALLAYRGTAKLMSTYIVKLPKRLSADGRIHCRFNQYGADTGRFSSSEPNLQNIPSHNKDIRKMFVASPGYVMMSSDFSQQEPKCLAALCRQDGDSQMYDTFMAGKDLYVEIASKAFNKPYDECKEFRPDGTTNKEGKERRSQAKTILLGVLYGRGVDSIADQLGTTFDKAKQIKESVFRGFPAIKKFEEESIQMSEDLGYVTTVCGRKRRLPSMMLPDYEVVWKNGTPPDLDPLSFTATDDDESKAVPSAVVTKWIRKVRSVPFRDKRKVFEEANKEGLWIIDHTKDKDVTKVVNARIQGSAADLTKLAMIKLSQSQHLKDLGFRMLIPVHDEIIAECPKENAKECATLLASIMSEAAEAILEMPIRCDVEVTERWYGESVEV